MQITHILLLTGFVGALGSTNYFTYTYQSNKYELAIEQIKSAWVKEVDRVNNEAMQNLDAAKHLGYQLASELENKKVVILKEYQTLKNTQLPDTDDLELPDSFIKEYNNALFVNGANK